MAATADREDGRIKVWHPVEPCVIVQPSGMGKSSQNGGKSRIHFVFSSFPRSKIVKIVTARSSFPSTLSHQKSLLLPISREVVPTRYKVKWSTKSQMGQRKIFGHFRQNFGIFGEHDARIGVKRCSSLIAITIKLMTVPLKHKSFSATKVINFHPELATTTLLPDLSPLGTQPQIECLLPLGFAIR